ncbi:ATP-grasp domain-containing protein [Hymenobacter actinosclerus]|uniref:ATP-grasp domain-containing protein n=1 Tax=Hymenobacter actinosclerus TaxID=82805 RepID=A0A1I0IXT4_9BACT|nr:ATP-grasp domain-containing protein [Hymenobacter actinosclerus]SEU02190.1 hypothetical protein SAMN04487998_3523 [Hymenobacter actinosclerus]
MHILYPSLPYETATPDPLWEPEYRWAQAQGWQVRLFDVETNLFRPATADPTPALYRGWMLTATEYATLAQRTPLLVMPAEYLASHEATGWYEAVREFTIPSTFRQPDNVPDFADGQTYFVKGLVKSFGTDSVVASPEQWQQLLTKQQMGPNEQLFVREFVPLREKSEQRFFVVNGRAYGAAGAELPPRLVPVLNQLAGRRFYSLDVARTWTGEAVVVEVGDGQVSDLKEWQLDDFGATVLAALAQ